MSAIIWDRVSMILRRVGSHTVVPDNPLAHLMYYLSCVSSVLELETDIPNIARFSDYLHYYELNMEEVDDVIRHCNNIRPEYLEGRCFYLLPELCPGSTNAFYDLEITTSAGVAAEITLPHAAAAVVIEGHSMTVTKRMFYTESWLPDNYRSPMAKLRPWLAAMESNSARPVRQCGIKICPESPFPESDDPFSKNIGANLLISYFFPLWIFVWITMTIVQS